MRTFSCGTTTSSNVIPLVSETLSHVLLLATRCDSGGVGVHDEPGKCLGGGT